MEWTAVIKLDSRGYGSRSTVIERKVQILQRAAALPGILEPLTLFPQHICAVLLFRRLPIQAYLMRKGDLMVK